MPLFFADECVAALIVEGLRSRGCDVVDAKEICQGDTDERALALAAAAGRVLITDDRGFGELAVRHERPATGVIIWCAGKLCDRTNLCDCFGLQRSIGDH
jgi:predicted nuclease of predicted toxin-antitoxin system